MFTLRPSSDNSNSFFMLFIHSAFCYVLPVTIFYSKIVSVFFCVWLWICSCVLSTNLLVEFSIFILEGLSPISLGLFLTVILLGLSAVVFFWVFSFHWIPVCFTFSHSFSICPSNLIFIQVLYFCSDSFRAIPILSLTSSAPV